MKQKNICLTAAALAFFLAGGLYLLHHAVAGRDRLHVSFEPVLQGFSEKAVTRLVFYQGNNPDSKTALSRPGPDLPWSVAGRHGAPANLLRIKALMERLELLTGEIRYREDTEISHMLGLDEKDAFHLEIYTENPEKPAWHLLLGRPGGVRFTVFLRKEGDARIFLANMLLYPGLGMNEKDLQKPVPPGFWLDLEAYDIPATDIAGARVTWRDGRVLTLTRLKDRDNPEAPEGSGRRYEWKVGIEGTWNEKVDEWDQEALGAYVDRLRIVMFNDVAGPLDSRDFGLDAPALEVRLERTDGKTVALRTGGAVGSADNEKTGHYAGVGEERFVYLLSDFQFQRMHRGPEKGRHGA